MNISKRDLLSKIVHARTLVDSLREKHGGSKYPYLAGAYEGIFAELLGSLDFNKLLYEASKRCTNCVISKK